MAELNVMWTRIFDQIRHVCVVKGMTMPAEARAVSCSGEEVVIYLPEGGAARYKSGALNSRESFDILVNDSAGMPPFRFTKSDIGQLHWHRPPVQPFRVGAPRASLIGLLLGLPALLHSCLRFFASADRQPHRSARKRMARPM